MKFLPARHLCYFWPKFLRMEYWANLRTLWRWCNQQPSSLSTKIIWNHSIRVFTYFSNVNFFINSYHITFVSNKEFVDWFGCISVDFLQPLFYIIEWILIYKNQIRYIRSIKSYSNLCTMKTHGILDKLAIYRAKIALKSEDRMKGLDLKLPVTS